MSLGLIGRKVGMTRVFGEDGRSTPVTVVEVEPNRVTQEARLFGWHPHQVAVQTALSHNLRPSLPGALASISSSQTSNHRVSNFDHSVEPFHPFRIERSDAEHPGAI